MKALDTLAWFIAVVAIVAVYTHRTQLAWYLRNKSTVDKAVEVGNDTADFLGQIGVKL